MPPTKWALVYWPPSTKNGLGSSDVVSIKCIKRKDERVEGAQTKLPWINSVTKETEYCVARVLKIHRDRQFLSKLPVDAKTGEIPSQGQKIFTKPDLDKKKQCADSSSDQRHALKEGQKSIEKAIASHSGLFEDDGSSKSEKTQDDDADDGSDSSSTASEELRSVELPSSDHTEAGSAKPDATRSLAVTWENIVSLRKILKDMEADYYRNLNGCSASQPQVSSNPERQALPPLAPVLDKFKTSGPNKTQICSSGLFLPDGIYDALLKKSTTLTKEGCQFKDWKCLVKMFLIEIYSDQLAFYCAKGREGARTGIHLDIFRAVWDWAKEFSGQDVTEVELTKYINDLTYNKYRTWKKKNGVATPTTPKQAKRSKLSVCSEDQDSYKPSTGETSSETCNSTHRGGQSLPAANAAHSFTAARDGHSFASVRDGHFPTAVRDGQSLTVLGNSSSEGSAYRMMKMHYSGGYQNATHPESSAYNNYYPVNQYGPYYTSI